jgi:hypothetical protein
MGDMDLVVNCCWSALALLLLRDLVAVTKGVTQLGIGSLLLDWKYSSVLEKIARDSIQLLGLADPAVSVEGASGSTR